MTVNATTTKATLSVFVVDFREATRKVLPFGAAHEFAKILVIFDNTLEFIEYLNTHFIIL